MPDLDLTSYLRESRELVVQEITSFLPRDPRSRAILYDLMLDYPLRSAKALRPALCIATCRALGGHLESVLRSAAVLELYHNAFLIHDDVEDGSEHRRDAPTLHRRYGVAIAVNVGDAMLALTLEPLLDNMRTIGMGKALRILRAVARMARESAEGQAIELDWIRHGLWTLRDADYVRMVYKKTSWYTFITPTIIGAVIAHADEARLVVLRKFASLLGVAFQMQDDILNLTAERAYGKEIGGDLWEGKHTVLLLHMMRSATAAERERARAILRKRRPDTRDPGGHAALGDGALRELVAELHARGDMTRAAADAITRHIAVSPRSDVKTPEDVAFLVALMERYGSVAYATEIAQRWARKARAVLEAARPWLEDSVHRAFMEQLVDFVVERGY
jgi:geranylgeranyl diphosphate synthase type II